MPDSDGGIDEDTLRAIAPRIESVMAFRAALRTESDRGCALLAAAYLDEQLAEAVRDALVDDEKVAGCLLNSGRALGTFSTRIDMAYLLGLLGPRARRDLHLIRRIRNEFAHYPTTLAFDNDRVANRCGELHFRFEPDQAARDAFCSVSVAILAIVHARLSPHFPAADRPKIMKELSLDEAYKEGALAHVPSLLPTLLRMRLDLEPSLSGDSGEDSDAEEEPEG